MVNQEETSTTTTMDDLMMIQNLTSTIDDTSCPPSYANRIPDNYESLTLKNEIKRSISSNSNLQLLSLSTGVSIYRSRYNQLRKFSGLDFKTQQRTATTSFPTKKDQAKLLGSLEEKRFIQLREQTRRVSEDEEGDDDDDEEFWVDDDENMVDDDEM